MNYRKALALALASIWILVASAPAAPQTVAPPEFEVETWARGLDSPAAFDFMGPDDLLVLERTTGRVVRVTNGEIGATVLTLDVATDGTRGGLGLAVAPDFATSGAVYVFYSAAEGPGGEWLENRLVRTTFNGSRLVKPRTLAGFPAGAEADANDQNGGALRFGPDGMLYAQVGSLGRGVIDPRVEQNGNGGTSSGAGGILRVDADGNPAADNPFVEELEAALHGWFAFGVRDGAGIAFDPVTGSLWFADRGPGAYDEVNRAASGMNGGWRLIAGPDKRDAAFDANGNTPADKRDLPRIPGSEYADPAFSWAAATGVSSLVFLDTERYGAALRNQLLVGDTAGNLHLFELKKRKRQRDRLVLQGPIRDRVADSAAERGRSVWGSEFGAVSDLRVGPDGYLWAADQDGGRLLRVVPFVAPTARYRVTFDGAWSAESHPDPGFPDNPHFSGLIGATHGGGVTFWQAGELASEGIRRMSELGSKSPLDDEVRDAIASGLAENLLSGGGIASSPGSVSLEFEISRDFPLVTLVSMLAPSPDWFAGVSGLPLYEGGGWASTKMVDLFAYDAGTDSGPNYTSGNAESVPREPITHLSGPPFLVNGQVPRVGTFTFERIR